MLTRNPPTKALVSGLLILSCFQALPAVAAPFSAVLPSSRSVEVGVTATAFATILNADDVIAEGCSITPSTGVDAAFTYQTTDPASNAVTGTVNTPVDIAAGSSQSFVIAMTPNSDFPATDVQFDFNCSTGSATSFTGINTLLLSGNSSPVADVVAVAVTPGGGGISRLPRDGVFGLMSLATTNVGSAATITARPVDLSGLDGFLRICETDQDTSNCLEEPTEETTGPLAADQTRTYSVFINSNTRIFLDAANRRTAVEFVDEFGNIRGSTSVAIEGGGPSAQTFFSNNIADQIIQPSCTSCHVAGGDAEASPLVFEIDEVPGFRETNFAVIDNYFKTVADAEATLIGAATGMNGHPQIVTEDSPVINTFQVFFELLETE